MEDRRPTTGSDVYDDPAAVAEYLAHRHSGASSPNTVMEEPAFLAELGRADAQRVVDLGCGDGSTAPLVMARGAASYRGIDRSATMVHIARRRHGDDERVIFQHGSIEDVELPRGSVDLVISRMALHHVADLGPVLRRVRAALGSSGRLLFSVVHPVITSTRTPDTGRRTDWTVDDYFVPGPRKRPWFGHSVTWYHRTIEQHVRALHEAGFTLDALRECAPDPEVLGGDPDELRRRRRVPLVLLISAVPRW